MGWDELRSLSQQPGVENKELELMQSRFAALFGCDLGESVLEDFRLNTEAKTTLPGGAVDGEAMKTFMAVREGENNFYRWIKAMTNKGLRKEKPNV